MTKRLRLALVAVALLAAGYLTGNPVLVSTGISSVVQAVQE